MKLGSNTWDLEIVTGMFLAVTGGVDKFRSRDSIPSWPNRWISSILEFLSIDAEGYDFEVLLGATKTLRRTKYLEFEYHDVGVWPQYSLWTAISLLKEMHFVCYWAGSHGHLWRITDCWSIISGTDGRMSPA
jgi:Methyltransferase FkbM domain